MKKKEMERKEKHKEALPVIKEDIFTTSSSTDFSKMAEKLYNVEENLELISDLTPRQINSLNKIKQMGIEYGLEILNELYWRFLMLRVSKKRDGRKEGVGMTQQIISLKRLESIENAMYHSGGIKK